MRIPISCLLTLWLAGTLPGCHRREPAAFVPQTVAADAEINRNDDDPATYEIEDTSIVEVEPVDAEATLTVRVVIPQLGETEETFYLKKVVTHTIFHRNTDGSYSGSMVVQQTKPDCFRWCRNGSGFRGSTEVSFSPPDRVNVSIQRSWTFPDGVKGEAGGEIEVPWMGKAQKAFGDGAALHAAFIAVDDPKP